MIHSYTSLSTFLKCPLRYKAQYIDKRIPKVSSPAMERGNKMHKMLEDALRRGDGTAPTAWMADGLWPLLLAFREKHTLFVEEKLETDSVLGKIDVRMSSDYQSIMLDWKMGKYRPDELQADVYAYLVYKCTLHDSAELTFVYIDEKRLSPPYKPGKDAIGRVEALVERVESEQKYFPKPDWYCGWCPVKDCRYNKEK